MNNKNIPKIALGTWSWGAGAAGGDQVLGNHLIDVYWIHNLLNVEKWIPDLILLVQSGQIKSIGVSNHNLAELKRANEIFQ